MISTSVMKGLKKVVNVIVNTLNKFATLAFHMVVKPEKFLFPSVYTVAPLFQ